MGRSPDPPISNSGKFLQLSDSSRFKGSLMRSMKSLKNEEMAEACDSICSIQSSGFKTSICVPKPIPIPFLISARVGLQILAAMS